MAQLELFPLISIETVQAYCWNAHARLEAIKHRNPHSSQTSRLLGEMSLFLLQLEKIETELAHRDRSFVPPPPAPKHLEVAHLRALNHWPDLALSRARRVRAPEAGRQPPST